MKNVQLRGGHRINHITQRSYWEKMSAHIHHKLTPCEAWCIIDHDRCTTNDVRPGGEIEC